MRKTLVFASAAACLWAQSGLDRPWIGQMIDAHGILWPVYGVGGSFVLGRAQARGVLSTACSRQLCLAKTASAILMNGVPTQAPAGTAEFGLEGAGALVYFPQSRELAQWDSGKLTISDQPIHANILSLRADGARAVRRADQIWIESADAGILDSLPPDADAVLLISGATVYATADALVIRHPSAAPELRFPATGVADLFAMGDGYVEARTANGLAYALRTDPGHEQLFLLPQGVLPPSPRAPVPAQ